MKTLAVHRFPEAIPLMAPFVNADFAQDIARTFLVEMTGVDFGGNSSLWLNWYRSNKRRLRVQD